MTGTSAFLWSAWVTAATCIAEGDAPEFIKFRHIRNCHAADPAYGAGVARALGIDLQKALASRQADPMFGNPLVPLPA